MKGEVSRAGATVVGLLVLSATVAGVMVSCALEREGAVPRRGWTDLLKLVDRDSDAVAGEWTVREGNLICDDTPSARISFRYQPPKEYDFLVEFTVTDAGACTAQLVSKGTVPFTWSMNAGSPRRCRIEDIDGHSVIGNPTLRKHTFEPGRRYVSVVCVRDDGVTCLVNGQVIAEHKTDYSDLSRNTKWRMPERLRLRLGVGAWHGPTTFHRAAVRLRWKCDRRMVGNALWNPFRWAGHHVWANKLFRLDSARPPRLQCHPCAGCCNVNPCMSAAAASSAAI